MSFTEAAGQRLLLELRARDAWSQRDYPAAQELAEELASSARSAGDELGWWNAKFLASECLRWQGMMQDSRAIAEQLGQHSLTSSSRALSARVFTQLSLALQGTGDLAAAVTAARQALREATKVRDDISVEVDARNTLIAALADSDRLQESWQECLALVDVLRVQPPTKQVGQSYWAIGNVAFLLQRLEDGVAYHQLAAENLSPVNDLDLWARFNRASAALRLTAGVIEPETLECIERAELASSIVGGTKRDRLELQLTRAQWLVLTGQSDAAIDELTAIISHKELLASHVAAEAHFLLGQALSAREDDREAIRHLEFSEELFLQSGAEDRSSIARALIDNITGLKGVQPTSVTREPK